MRACESLQRLFRVQDEINRLIVRKLDTTVKLEDARLHGRMDDVWDYTEDLRSLNRRITEKESTYRELRRPIMHNYYRVRGRRPRVDE